MTLTALIITKNAQDTLEATLRSVFQWANEIIVVDDYSTDKTVEIAQKYKARTILHHGENFGEQRGFALAQVGTEWTLVLDSDEVLTGANKKEMHSVLLRSEFDGYFLHFRNHLFGKRLMHGELHKKLVLFKTKKGSIRSKLIHEQYAIVGAIGELTAEVIHNSYRTPFQILSKFFNYSLLQAEEYKRTKKQWGVKELFLYPFHMFYARYIKDKGYKDGISRLFLDVAFAQMEFNSYAFIPFVKSKKRLAIDCGLYPVGGIVQSGIDRLIQGIYSHQNETHDYYWFGFHPQAKNRLPSFLFSQLWLPLAVIFNRIDVFFGVSGTTPFLLKFFRVKKILFLYDFGFLRTPDNYNNSADRLREQTNNSIKLADEIIFLHNEIYKEFIKLYPDYCYKAHIISSGANHLQEIKEIPVFIQSRKPVYLSVGVVKPIKRIEVLVSVVDQNYTVLAGSHESSYANKLHLQEKKNIQCVQKFNDGQLRWLYTHSDILVNTSENEGFCYPMLEALTLGLPVVAFDLPLFHEYKQYFPHLMLVSSEGEMKTMLKKNTFIKNNSVQDHPYLWSSFNEKLLAIVNGRACTPPRCARPKVAFIVILYKTTLEEKMRLENEIKDMGIDEYRIYWIDNSGNGKGYAAGINEGIRKGLIDGCDLFVAMNPDISLKNIKTDHIENARKHFDVWGYGMKQENKIFYGGKIDLWRLSGSLIEKKPNQDFTTVDFVSASIICFTKETVQTIGLWDESYFMYYEDVDYCIRAKRKGLRVGVSSEVIYEHFEVSQFNDKKAEWIGRSRWKFFWNYSNGWQKIREIIRLPKTLLKL